MIQTRLSSFQKFSLATLFYIVLVILWGAFVRATGSGAGCGEHWPLCNGQIVPQSPQWHTMVEFGHRLTSGLSLIAVVVLTWLALKRSKVKIERRFAWASLIFILGEAAVGAVLVLQRLVANDDSTARAFVIAAHLINTYFLLGALTGVAWFSFFPALEGEGSNSSRRDRSWFFRIFAVLLMLIGASGAIVALGDTLFPAESIKHGIAQHFDDDAHILLRLRWIHPILAVVTTIAMTILLPLLFRSDDQSSNLKHSAANFAKILSWILIFQIGLGVLNVVLLAPTWMQLVHLFVADVVWICFCCLWLAERREQKVSKA